MTDKVQRIRNEIKRLKNQYMSYADDFHSLGMEDKRDHYAVLASVMEAILNFIDTMQEEPETKFKIGDRIRLKGTTVKGDTIIKIYTSEVGNTYFEFKNSGIASADLDWELVEEPKKCMFTKEEFTEEDRKILCEDCEEGCEYAKKEEPVSVWHDGCENPKSETNVLMIRKDEEDSNYPPIAGCFHGTNFRLDGKNWGYYNGFCYNEIEPPVKWAYLDDILKLSNVGRTVKDCKVLANATEVTVHIEAGNYPYIPQIELYDYDKDIPLAKEGEKYKVILIKEE